MICNPGIDYRDLDLDKNVLEDRENEELEKDCHYLL